MTLPVCDYCAIMEALYPLVSLDIAHEVARHVSFLPNDPCHSRTCAMVTLMAASCVCGTCYIYFDWASGRLCTEKGIEEMDGHKKCVEGYLRCNIGRLMRTNRKANYPPYRLVSIFDYCGLKSVIGDKIMLREARECGFWLPSILCVSVSDMFRFLVSVCERAEVESFHRLRHTAIKTCLYDQTTCHMYIPYVTEKECIELSMSHSKACAKIKLLEAMFFGGSKHLITLISSIWTTGFKPCRCEYENDIKLHSIIALCMACNRVSCKLDVAWTYKFFDMEHAKVSFDTEKYAEKARDLYNWNVKLPDKRLYDGRRVRVSNVSPFFVQKRRKLS